MALATTHALECVTQGKQSGALANVADETLLGSSLPAYLKHVGSHRFMVPTYHVDHPRHLLGVQQQLDGRLKDGLELWDLGRNAPAPEVVLFHPSVQVLRTYVHEGTVGSRTSI